MPSRSSQPASELERETTQRSSFDGDRRRLLQKGAVRWTTAYLLALSAMGCGSNGSRCEVSGSVTFAGELVTDGEVRFLPLDGGPNAGTPIVAGEFTLGSAQGLLPGRYKVEIDARRATGKMLPMPGEPGETYEEKVTLATTTREIDVEAGADNDFSFELQPE